MSKNSPAVARKWLEFVAARPEFPRGARLLRAFEAGEITRLCDCGCNSFDITVPAESEVEPIATAGQHGGVVFRLEFATGCDEDSLHMVSFLVFASKDGNFAGIDVDYCGNSFPVPDDVTLKEPPLIVEHFKSLLR